ncbi:hypothetical protein [Paenibacillus donghaensis]|uniref:Uncharacterized protein n=1 Tax=Paenibacillus donghaensis TaxID=414771 RepID=A0A2Z2KFC0_9BACL|nr:hypothetical protein [Paenibacillus donghaensis]ASA22665.1 hypothetical protein B9T62_18835 [Paenibacillus donghaensis]
MADCSCEWCDKSEVCKYSYQELDCIPTKQIELSTKITRCEVDGYLKLVEELKKKDEDIFHELIWGYQNIINDYPTEDELIYAREITI